MLGRRKPWTSRQLGWKDGVGVREQVLTAEVQMGFDRERELEFLSESDMELF